jgi:hypothetical protein
MTVPAVLGVRPRSDLKIAFSMPPTAALSQGVMTSVRRVLDRDVRDLVQRHLGAVVLDA